MGVFGNEWPAPHIVYWNLRGNAFGFEMPLDSQPRLYSKSDDTIRILSALDEAATRWRFDKREEVKMLNEDGVMVKKNPFCSVIRL